MAWPKSQLVRRGSRSVCVPTLARMTGFHAALATFLDRKQGGQPRHQDDNHPQHPEHPRPVVVQDEHGDPQPHEGGQADEDHPFRLDPVVEVAERDRRQPSRHVRDDPEDDDLTGGEAEHLHRQHRPEREHTGQPVTEQRRGEQEPDRVRGRAMDAPDGGEQAPVGLEDPLPEEQVRGGLDDGVENDPTQPRDQSSRPSTTTTVASTTAISLRIRPDPHTVFLTAPTLVRNAQSRAYCGGSWSA